MYLSESLKQALDSLRANKLRSILTMLGIIMGVFSVITIVAIGNAAQAYMNAQFEKLGANIIMIMERGKNVNPNDWLIYEDMEVIKKAVPEIKNIHAYVSQYGEIRIGPKARDASVMGVSSQYKNFRPVEMASGRFINDIDVSTRANVTIVDENFAKKYFKKTDITGESILLRSISGDVLKLRVIGVTKNEGGMFENMFGEDFPVTVYMPVTTVQGFFSVKKLSGLEVSVMEKDQLQSAGRRIVEALQFKHRNKDKYAATNSADIQKSVSSVLNVVSSVLLVIAVITLIVGGIGIINILLVSVTERIREIGVRKALGAQKKDIVLQFLTESIIMTGVSGLVGIILGIAAGGIIAWKIDIPPVVDLKVIIMAFLGSVTLGLIFGVYPAKRAADLDPIESLRYE